MYNVPPPNQSTPSGCLWVAPTASILGLILHAIAWITVVSGTCGFITDGACLGIMFLLNIPAFMSAAVGLIVTSARKHQLVPWIRSLGYASPMSIIVGAIYYFFILYPSQPPNLTTVLHTILNPLINSLF